MPVQKRKLIKGSEAMQRLGIKRSMLRLLRLSEQLSTIKTNEEGKPAPAGGFWYDEKEVEALARQREKNKRE